ncbi:hypothetical protein QSJ18_20035 [Gordonia sp. ABSL1-1]|uniref:trypsin-like serine protease n=1 Tax=Gordonia sp. ABSL1-1 TaxID=3053923 RepID=UPI00257296B2|nr:trypsin-like serine protease [Gordonia sp. ABSL1-1]MDL9939038.1 hypothetical protein [Gordonia sp. ABSL1-1]
MRKKFLAAAVLVAGMVTATPAVTAEAAPAVSVRSGMLIYVDETIITESKCTLGAVISPVKAITAGHCGEVGRSVYDNQGRKIGRISANRITKGLDIAVIRLVPRARVAVDTINWRSGFFRGQVVTKRGVTTGFTRGVISDPTPKRRTANGISFAPPFLVRHATVSVRANLRSAAGDSGAGIRDANGAIIGILSSGSSERSTAFAPVKLLPQYLR